MRWKRTRIRSTTPSSRGAASSKCGPRRRRASSKLSRNRGLQLRLRRRPDRGPIRGRSSSRASRLGIPVTRRCRPSRLRSVGLHPSRDKTRSRMRSRMSPSADGETSLAEVARLLLARRQGGGSRASRLTGDGHSEACLVAALGRPNESSQCRKLGAQHARAGSCNNETVMSACASLLHGLIRPVRPHSTEIPRCECSSRQRARAGSSPRRSNTGPRAACSRQARGAAGR